MKFSREIAGKIEMHDYPAENRGVMEKFGWAVAEVKEDAEFKIEFIPEKKDTPDIPIIENFDSFADVEKQNPVNKGGRPKKNK